MSDQVLVVEGLRKKFGNLEAVSGVDFSVFKSEIFGFLGPNGAGKSTTINMLCTMLTPSSGTARVMGFDIVKQRQEVRKNIGIIFQENTLDEKLTAGENLLLHCKFYAIPKAERSRRIEEVLGMVELQDKKDTIVETFSGGMKRRLEIARGLLHYPKVLFLDEPTVGLDPQTRAHIWDYIMELKKREGITIFLTTHYMDEAEFSDRVAIMDHGRIIALDTPSVLKSQTGGDIIEVSTEDNQLAGEVLAAQYGKKVAFKDGKISFSTNKGDEFLVEFIKNFQIPIKSINLRQPSLNDVFIKLTGREIREDQASADSIRQNKLRGARRHKH